MIPYQETFAGRDAVVWLHLALMFLVFVAAWLGGGVTEDSSSVDEWLQLLALPVLVMAVIILADRLPTDRLAQAGIGAMLLIVLVPALQLLPLPSQLWLSSPARASLAHDLAQAGVNRLSYLGTLAPQETEKGLWSLLPAIAFFLGGLALPSRTRRRALIVVVAIVLMNAVFAFYQAGLPPESELRLYQYPDGSAAFGGLLINHNHHATVLVIGMVLSVGLGIDAWRRRRGGQWLGLYLWHAGAALFCLLLIPLTGSRAGAALALPMLGAVLLLAGALPLERIKRSKGARFALAGVAFLALLGLWLMRGRIGDVMSADPRFAVANATFAMGGDYLPWGSGIGSFVEVFAQNAPNLLMMPAFANHAHNEYAEWWLTGGLPAMLALAVVLVVLTIAGLRILRLNGRSGDAVVAASCWVAIVTAVLHSWVDFPLRTTTVMTTVALMAGLMLASLSEARARSSRRRSRTAFVEAN